MISVAFARLSSGTKMFLILSMALLPLGLIALLASIESASTNRLSREAEARTMASATARELSRTIARAAVDLRDTASVAVAAPDPRAACRAMLQELARRQRLGARYAVVDIAGRRLCVTPGFAAAPIVASLSGIGTEIRLVDGIDALRFSIALPGHVAVGELPQPTLVRLTQPGSAGGRAQLALRQGEATIPLAADDALGSALLDVSSPVAGGQLQLELSTNAAPLRALETLLVLLPILMWLAAALIGWLVVDRLLLRPLARLQHAIAAYGAGNRTLVLPMVSATPAQEIRRLGEAFREVTDQLTRHEADLERGLARQTKLTREVHHRVKNNLQVVASLINLHARGVSDPDVGAAYATIQRRVDALAVVHRNHYAELEENRGVGLRPLIGELAQNLRATAPPGASQLSISLDLMPAFAHQDVALPVAFLITELIEMVMNCSPRSRIAIALVADAAPDRARLTIGSPALADAACRDYPSRDRMLRVIEGLSRQLRTRMDYDEVEGRYAVDIRILPAAVDA